MRALIASAVVIMFGIADVRAGEPDKERLSDNIHASLMERYPEYRGIHETKVMAICIRWDSPTPPPTQVLGVFVTHTAMWSDRPTFTPVLRRNAIHRCKGWAAREKAECTCQVADENGKNVLRVP